MTILSEVGYLAYRCESHKSLGQTKLASEWGCQKENDNNTDWWGYHFQTL